MSNQLVITSGAKVRSLEGVITGSTGVLNSLPINVANGIPQLDSNGKILVSQLPNSVMEYKGTWDAATNTPTLANGTGNQGDVYLCNVAGTVNFGAGPITFYVGDQVIYSGSIWQRASGASGTVTSVAVTESGDALTITGSPITTSGTINIGFAGTSAQYVAGDGSLITFPSTATAAQNLITEVYNETGATLTKGTVVYINGGHGNLPTVAKAIATSDATSAQTYGVVRADITNMNNGFVTVIGSLSDLDTQAYANGTQLYLSGTTAGAWTSTKPSAPIHLVYVGIVVRSHPTQGVVEVRIQNGYELGELHDVAISSPTINNEGIFYNSSTSLWENKSISTALGYTPANDSLVVHLAGNETITGLKTFNTPVAFDNALNVKFDASITAFGGYYSIYAIKGVGSGNSTLALYDGDTNKRISLSFYNSSDYTYLFPAASGTVALTSQLTSGTVTSVALSAPTGFSVSGSPVTTSGTLALSFAAGYSLPTTASQTNWDTAYSLRITSASSPLSITSNVLSISQATTSTDGYLSSTDWNTFNSKQNALTNPVTGTGTSGQVTYFNGTSSITGSNNLKFDGTNLLIGNPSSALAQLYVYNASAAASFLLKTNSASDYSEIAVRNYNDTSTSYFRQYSSSASGSDFGISRANLALFFSNYASNFAIGTRNGGDLILGTADTERARLLASNGYFGIGTSSPSYLLDVNGTGRFTGALNGTSAVFSSSVTAAGINSTIAKSGTGVESINLLNLRTTGTGAIGDSQNIRFINTDGTNIANISGILGGDNVAYGSLAFSIRSYNTDAMYEAMRINNRGNVGIGTSSPTSLLHVGSVSGSGTPFTTPTAIQMDNSYKSGSPAFDTLKFYLFKSTSESYGFTVADQSDLQYWAGTTASGMHRWFTSQTERMRITSGGNVGIGTSSPNLTASGRTTLDINGTSTSLLAFSIGGTWQGYIYHTATDSIYWTQGARNMQFGIAEAGFMGFGTNNTERMRITSGGDLRFGNTGQNGQFIYGNSNEGYLSISGGEAAGTTYGANITLVSNSRGGSNLRGELSLSAGNTGGTGSYINLLTNGTERVRITSDGLLDIKGNNNNVSGMNALTVRLGSNCNNTSSYGYVLETGGANKTFIYGNGNIVNVNNSYGTLSDISLKENIIDATPKLYDLLQLKVRNFNLIGDETKQIGFIAQEFEEVFPSMVETDGKSDKKMIKTSVLVPMLVKAIQELKAEIDELKNKN
jgi:hypothetical protein